MECRNVSEIRYEEAEPGWCEAWTCKFGSRSHTLASWLIAVLNEGVLGRWINSKQGIFELEWAEAAQNWYLAKKRHSRMEDSAHLLHKGIQAAFPKLTELDRQRTGHQCTRRVFVIGPEICKEVEEIVIGTSNKHRKRKKDSSGSGDEIESIWPNLPEKLFGQEYVNTMHGLFDGNTMHGIFDGSRPPHPTPLHQSPQGTPQQHFQNNEQINSPWNYVSSSMVPGHTFKTPDEAQVKSVMYSAKDQLKIYHGWAKTLTDFNVLQPRDRKSLLRGSICELLTLGLAQRSVGYKGKLRLANGLTMDPDVICDRTVKFFAVSVINTLMHPLEALNLSNTEYEMLKRILLFNPDCDMLEDSQRVRQIRHNTHLALQGDIPPHLAGRFGEILLLLAPLRTISSQFVEQLHMQTLLGAPDYIDAFLILAFMKGDDAQQLAALQRLS